MHDKLTNNRNLDLSKELANGDLMISAKFLAVCGILLSVIVSFISTHLVIGSVAVSAYNLSSRLNNKTYAVSVLLLVCIAMRAAWLMQVNQ